MDGSICLWIYTDLFASAGVAGSADSLEVALEGVIQRIADEFGLEVEQVEVQLFETVVRPKGSVIVSVTIEGEGSLVDIIDQIIEVVAGAIQEVTGEGITVVVFLDDLDAEVEDEE